MNKEGDQFARAGVSMSRTVGVSWLVCGLLVGMAAAQQTTASADRHEASVYAVPFSLNEVNNIVVQATLNDVDDVALMFHTATSSLMLTERGANKAPSVIFDQSAKISSWGGNSNVRFSASNVLRVGELTWDAVPITEDRYSGPGTDGKFGPDLFQGRIIEIDFDQCQLRVRSLLPENIAKYQQLRLITDDGMAFVRSSLRVAGESLECDLLLHSGFGGTVLVDDEFAQEANLANRLEIVSQRELRDSLGNTLVSKRAVVPSFSLGNCTFDSFPVEFFDGAIGQRRVSTTGTELLRRFNIVIDTERGHIYLKPNANFKAPFDDPE